MYVLYKLYKCTTCQFKKLHTTGHLPIRFNFFSVHAKKMFDFIYCINF